MKRRLLTVVCSLVLGMVANFAVAWGLALWVTEPLSELQLEHDLDLIHPHLQPLIPKEWITLGPGQFGTMGTKETRTTGWRSLQFGVSKRVRTDGKLGPDYVVHLIETGWPLRSVRCVGQVDWRVLPQNGGVQPTWTGGFAPPASWKPHAMDTLMFFASYPRPIPYSPRWQGLVVNSVAYATGFWLLWGTFSLLRQGLRRRRGLCPKCAYPVGSAGACTECGTAVSIRTANP